MLVPKDVAPVDATKQPLMTGDAWIILKGARCHSALVDGYSKLAIMEPSKSVFSGRECSDSSPLTRFWK